MILQATIRKVSLFLIPVFFIAVLCSCGKKPTGLEAPDMTLSTFPQKYPQTETIPGNGPQFANKAKNDSKEEDIFEQD